MPRPTIRRAVLSVAGLALALSACGGDDGNVNATSTGSSTPSAAATVASRTAAPSASATATTASSAPNLCDFVTKAQLEAIAGKPTTLLDKRNTERCAFRHDYKVDRTTYAAFNGAVTITTPKSAGYQASSMKSFRQQYADGQPYPCDVGEDCAVVFKNQGTESRLIVGPYWVYFNAIVVTTPGAPSSSQNVKAAQERSVKLLQIVADYLAKH